MQLYAVRPPTSSFGPFVSTPERGWRTFLSGPLLGLLADGDRVVGNANQPVLEDGTPIGYPPLHNHHVHVRKGDRQRNLGRTTNNHWFESHGDYPDGPSYGFGAPSTAGYATTLPPGYCVLVDEAADLDVEAEVNGVRRRSPADGADSLPYFALLEKFAAAHGVSTSSDFAPLKGQRRGPADPLNFTEVCSRLDPQSGAAFGRSDAQTLWDCVVSCFGELATQRQEVKSAERQTSRTPQAAISSPPPAKSTSSADKYDEPVLAATIAGERDGLLHLWRRRSRS